MLALVNGEEADWLLRKPGEIVAVCPFHTISATATVEFKRSAVALSSFASMENCTIPT